MNTVKIALIQASCVANVEQNVQEAIAKVKEAAQNGAKIVCLQELFNTLYIGQDVDVSYYDYAEILPGKTSDRFGALSKELGIVTIVPMYEFVKEGIYFNSVVVYDADGSYLGKYRKEIINGFKTPIFFDRWSFYWLTWTKFCSAKICTIS